MPAVAVPASVAVLCLGEVVWQGGVMEPGRWYEVAPDVAEHWMARGAVVTQARIDALWHAQGRTLTPDGVASHYEAAEPMTGAVRVLQLTHYDPGASVYRYHSAANAVPGVVSAFARLGHSNPSCDLRQWDVAADRDVLRVLLLTADVVHCHMDYVVLLEELGGLPRGMRAAITYHGSEEPGRAPITYPDADARMRSVVFGARPYHRRYGATWLPIPIPVADYAALAKGHRRGATFRVAHSPTRRAIKGTDTFLNAVARVNDAGVPVEAVLIEGMPHGEALRVKATCDATFDSLWLGLQGSGLEAAAMGQAVIAGDPEAVSDYRALGVEAPWTFANDEDALVAVLTRLATDAAYFAAEADRVSSYVRNFHDYPVVGARYRDILTGAVRGVADAQ